MEAKALSFINKSLAAASKGDIHTLETLRNQFDVNRCVDRYGATPVHYAARTGKLDCLRWLVQTAGLSGSKQANNGATPAHDAAATGQLDCLQWLIQHGGCSANCRDASQATPLHLAARFDQVSVVVWLIESEESGPVEKAKNGITPLHLAAARGSLNVVRWLSQNALSAVNRRADNGATPVYFAAQEGHLNCLQFLVTQVDGNCRLRANDGMAPIHAAAQMGRLDCVVWLVEKCHISPMERDNDGATPVHFAAARGHVEVLRWLLTHNGGIVKDDLGGTPLHDAAEHGQIEAVQLLVSMGADPHACDSDGLTPADLAEECDFESCSLFLRSRPFLPVKTLEVDLSKEQPFSAALVKTVLDTSRPLSITSSPKISNEDRTIRKESLKSNAQPQIVFQNLKKPSTPPRREEQKGPSELASMFRKMHSRPANERIFNGGIRDSNEENRDIKPQDQELMDEVRFFDKSTLERTLINKRHLHPFKFGHIRDDESSGPTTPTLSNKSSHKDTIETQNHHQHQTPIISNSLSTPLTTNTNDDEFENLPLWKKGLIKKNKREEEEKMKIESNEIKKEEEEDEEVKNLPLWKRGLIKKRKQEQIKKEKAKMEEVKEVENRWADVPEWKRKILMKKEEAKAKQRAIEDEGKRIQDAKIAKFDALPEWKKNIILKKQSKEQT